MFNILYIVCKKIIDIKKEGGNPSFFYKLEKITRLVFAGKQDGKEIG